MSVAESFRSFLLSFPENVQPIRKVAQDRIPKKYTETDGGYVFFTRRGTDRDRVLDPKEFDGNGIPINNDPDMHLFDVEVYDDDPDVTQQFADFLHRFDCYRGAFGSGECQLMLIESQSDDYVPWTSLEESEDKHGVFLSAEIRSYKE